MYKAVSRGDLRSVKVLVQNAADVNVKIRQGSLLFGNLEYDTCLQKAFNEYTFNRDEKNTYKQIVEILVKNGADPTVTNRQGQTIFTFIWFNVPAYVDDANAVDGMRLDHYESDTDMLKLLIDNCLDIMVKKKFNEALSKAAALGDKQLVEFLISKGIPVNSPDGKSSPIHTASTLGNLDMVKFLMKNGADVNLKDDFHGFAAVECAAFENHKDVVKFLVDNGAKKTLFSAVVLEDLNSIKELLEKGEDVNQRKYMEWTLSASCCRS